MYPMLADLCSLDSIVTEQNHDEAGRSSVWTVVVSPGGTVNTGRCAPEKKTREVSKVPRVDGSSVML